MVEQKTARAIIEQVTIKNQKELVSSVIDRARAGDFGNQYLKAIRGLNLAISREKSAELMMVQNDFDANAEMIKIHQSEDREVSELSTKLERDAPGLIDAQLVLRSGKVVEAIINSTNRGAPINEVLLKEELLQREISLKNYKEPVRKKVHQSFSRRQLSVERALGCIITVDGSGKNRTITVDLPENIDQTVPKKTRGTNLFTQFVRLEATDQYLKTLLSQVEPEDNNAITNVRALTIAIERVREQKEILTSNMKSKIREVKVGATKTLWADRAERVIVAGGLATITSLLTYAAIHVPGLLAENIVSNTFQKVTEYQNIISTYPAEIANLKAQFISLQSAASHISPESMLIRPDLVREAQQVLQMPGEIKEKMDLLQAAKPAIDTVIKSTSTNVHRSEIIARLLSIIGSTTIGVSVASFSEVLRNPRNVIDLFQNKSRPVRRLL